MLCRLRNLPARPFIRHLHQSTSATSTPKTTATMAPKRGIKTEAKLAEDNTVGPMYRFEKSLPYLPVPTLESTSLKYLESVKPLVSAEAYEKTKSVVTEFIASPQAAELQRRLQARADEPTCQNWLAEWWNEAAYMGYRDPVVVFVSYFYVHVQGKVQQTQARKAAELLKALLPFRELVEMQQLEPDKARQTPMCMASFKWLFNSSRYPAIPNDTARKWDPQSNNHVIFIRNNRFFEVALEAEGAALSTAELEAQIQNIINSAGSTKGVPVGVLTSENRDIWTEARDNLAQETINAKALERIESAVIVICLDSTSPTSRDELSWAAWTGDGRNRFYDKHQLIVFENGRSAFLGEHSCMDGTPTLRLNEFMLSALAANKVDHGSSSPRTSIAKPQEITFKLDSKDKESIKLAEKHFDELIGAHELTVLQMAHYGSSFIKSQKASPDAWAQLVKQLAFHKLYARPGVTYESAQTRKFRRGRTEVIRSATAEAKEWVESMNDKKVSNVDREAKFGKAVGKHLQVAAWAADGAGVDRHFFGLRKLIDPEETIPAIFTDKSFGISNHWELSTSNLSSPWLDGWGYGEVVPDGYGLAYSIDASYIRWTITCLKTKSQEGKGTKELKNALEQAALEVRDMMESAKKERESKL